MISTLYDVRLSAAVRDRIGANRLADAYGSGLAVDFR